MDPTRRGFMGLLAAFGIAPALPVEALAVETAPILTARPAKLGMWVRPFGGGEWHFIGAIQSLSVEPELQYLEHLYRDPLTRQQHITHRTLINRQYRILAEMDTVHLSQNLAGERLSLRYTMRLEDGEHEIMIDDAVIDGHTAALSVIGGDDQFSFTIEAVASGNITHRTPA